MGHYNLLWDNMIHYGTSCLTLLKATWFTTGQHDVLFDNMIHCGTTWLTKGQHDLLLNKQITMGHQDSLWTTWFAQAMIHYGTIWFTTNTKTVNYGYLFQALHTPSLLRLSLAFCYRCRGCASQQHKSVRKQKVNYLRDKKQTNFWACFYQLHVSHITKCNTLFNKCLFLFFISYKMWLIFLNDWNNSFFV